MIAIEIPKERLREFCRKWKVTEFALFGSVVAGGMAAIGQACPQAKPAPANVRVVTPPLTNYTALLVAREASK